MTVIQLLSAHAAGRADPGVVGLLLSENPTDQLVTPYVVNAVQPRLHRIPGSIAIDDVRGRGITTAIELHEI